MSIQELTLIVIVIAGVALIVTSRARPDLTALLILLALTFSGLVTPEQALSGFSSPVVIVIMGMFVATNALEDTGVVQFISKQIRTLSGGSETRLIMVFMATGAFLVLVMNIVAAGAMLLPAAMQVARDSNIRPSKLLIPVSFGTLLGAMASYFPSANIIMNGLLQERGYAPLHPTDFLLTGGLLVIAGLLYMALIGRRLLPERESQSQQASPLVLSRKLTETYQLTERLWELRVPAGSQLTNTALSHSRIGSEFGVTVVAIWRGHHAILAPEAIEIINTDDYLLVLGREERIKSLLELGLVMGRQNGLIAQDHDYTVDLSEVIIPPRSKAIGSSLTDLNFRYRYGLTTVALWRGGRTYRTDVGKMPLEVGDGLLMVGPSARIRQLAQSRDYLLLESSHFFQPPFPHKAKWALGIIGLILLSALLNILPIEFAVLLGWAGLVLTQTTTMDIAYRAIEWRVIFLVVGFLPISHAMFNTGLAERLSLTLVDVLSPYGPLALIAGLFFVTMATTQFIGSQVSGLVIGPVAIAAAIQAQVDPRAMAITVAVGCATAFLTPLAHPVSALMMGPGGYKFNDFPRVGIGLTVVIFVVLMLAMVWIWGL